MKAERVEQSIGGRPTIAVIGMHRSGTSAVSEQLCDAGAWVGDDDELLPADVFNEHGYFERVDVAKGLDDLLASLGGEWLNPPLARLMPSDLERVRPALRRVLSTVADDAPLDRIPLVKDPRLSLFASQLPTLLPSGSRIVVCLRHPLEVARSLVEAHSLNIRLGLALWEAYYATLATGLADHDVILVDYSRLVSEPAYVQTVVKNVLAPLKPAEWEPAKPSHVDSALRHQTVTAPDERQWLSAAQIALWTTLHEAARKPDPTRLIAAQLSGNAAEELRRAAESTELHRKLAGLEHERSEQRGQIEGLTADLGRATEAAASLQIRVEAVLADYAGVVAERDQATAAQAALEARLESSTSAHADLERDLTSALEVAEERSEAVRAVERALRAASSERVEVDRALGDARRELTRAQDTQRERERDLAVVTAQRDDLRRERGAIQAKLDVALAEITSQREQGERAAAQAARQESAIEDLARRNQNLVAQIEAVSRAADVAESAHELLKAEHNALATTFELLAGQSEALSSHLDDMSAYVEALSENIEYKQYQLATIAGSRSWRLTAPLRRLFGHGEPEVMAPPPIGAAPSLERSPLVHPTRPRAEVTSTTEAAATAATPDDADRDFDEATYLELHADVTEAVGRGDMPSGLHHYRVAGRAEGRIAPGFAPYADRECDISRLREKPVGLTVVGPMTASSGLGTSARGYVRASLESGLLTVARDVDVYGEDRGDADEWDAIGTRAALLVQNADIFPRLFERHDVHRLDDTYLIGLWACEVRGLRPEWFSSFGAVDEVWVPSRFCAEAVSATSPVPVHVMPHVVDPPAGEKMLPRSHFGLPDDVFTFLYAFDASSHIERKNPITCVKAFRAAFGHRGDVRLVLKLHSARPDDVEVQRLLEAVAGSPNIDVLDARLSATEMWSLKSAADCFCSPHRSEGFGLNIAEAMRLGKPVISTDFGGSTDFVNVDNGYPLSYRLRTVGRDIGPYRKHSVWAEPDLDDLVSIMRHVVESPAECAERGGSAATLMQEEYSAAAVGRRLRGRLEAVGLEEAGVNLAPRLGVSKRITERHPLGETSAANRERLMTLPDRPTISIAVPVFDVARPLLEACVESVRRQTYPFWELCLCDDGSTAPETVAYLDGLRGSDPRIQVGRLPRNAGIAAATNYAISMTSGEFVALLDNDDELAPQALMRVAETILANPAVDLLYTDEDKLEPDGSHSDDYHKPDWSPELLECTMYLLHMLVIRKSLLLQVGGLRSEYDGAQDYDLALRLSRATEEIVHLPEVLYHWRKIPGSAAEVVDAKPYALQRAQGALQEHVSLKYGDDAVVVEGTLPGLWRIRRGQSDNPPVTLLITTNNGSPELLGRGRVTLIDNVVASISEMTDYPEYRIVIVDNENLSPIQRKTFEGAGHRVVSYRGPQRPFNFADKANFTFSQADTDLVVLLNDDLEVLKPDWLGALVAHLQKPDVGIVGARLLSLEGRVQHAGVIGGVNGGTAHAFYGLPGDAVGYNGYTHVDRNYSMVTGACMATRKDVLAATGGFDRQFAIDFNDSDFCLTAISKGYRVVYTPHAELRHFESVTVPRDAPNPLEAAAFRRKWQWTGVLARDPYYNDNLSRFHVDFRRAKALAAPGQ